MTHLHRQGLLVRRSGVLLQVHSHRDGRQEHDRLLVRDLEDARSDHVVLRLVYHATRHATPRHKAAAKNRTSGREHDTHTVQIPTTTFLTDSAQHDPVE